MFRLGRFVSILATPLLAAMLLSAQSQDEKANKAPAAAKDTTVQGCLAKGDQPDTYQIQADGKTYVLAGKKDELEKHVGKMVAISGAPEKGASAEAMQFKVSAITKVADSCQ
jgi:uncharacterized protein YpmB